MKNFSNTVVVVGLGEGVGGVDGEGEGVSGVSGDSAVVVEVLKINNYEFKQYKIFRVFFIYIYLVVVETTTPSHVLTVLLWKIST